MKRIILASQSPRRKDLLTQMGVSFEIMPSNFEEHLDDARTPSEVAQELGIGKAMAVAEKNPDAYVIGSDTIVSIEGKQLGKAEDSAEAREMLRLLAGKSNEVTTSAVLVCINEGLRLSSSDVATVFFKPYDNAAVEKYLASNDWADKAGAYGIQSGAAALIDHISGRYDTILGLPTQLIAQFLQQVGFGIDSLNLQAPVPNHD